jgi:hypothetical protein
MTALSTNIHIIKLKSLTDEYLFQINKIERDVRTKTIVQERTIIELGGVQSGNLIVLYHAMPVSAKYEAAEAVIITNNGISR